MANNEETYVIDPEFTFWSDRLRCGAFMELFLAYYAHEVRQKCWGEPFEYRNWILRTAEET